MRPWVPILVGRAWFPTPRMTSLVVRITTTIRAQVIRVRTRSPQRELLPRQTRNHPMKLMAARSRSTSIPVNFRLHTSRSTPIQVVQSPLERKNSTSVKPTSSLRPIPIIPFTWVITATGRTVQQRWCLMVMVLPRMESVVVSRSR